MTDEITWLLKLTSAHLLTDFVLQPDSWVSAKREKHHKAPEFWYHAALAAFFSVAFTGFLGWWWIAPLIFITHASIDLWKSRRKDTLSIFFADQLLHFIIIFFIWQLRFPCSMDFNEVGELINNQNFQVVFLAIIFLTKPVGVITGMLTSEFRESIKEFHENTLKKAGSWIGIIERLIVFFLVLIGQWEAIGLLVAAKSIIRLRDGDQKMSEYVLIGTLISISIAIITGFIISKIIN